MTRPPRPLRRTRSWRRFGILIGALALLFAGVPAASANSIECGTWLYADTTLDHDLLDCQYTGLYLGADGITLDLNGHTVSGSGPIADFGIYTHGYDSVTVKNGTVTGFAADVIFLGDSANTVSDNVEVTGMTLTGDGYGIYIWGGTNNHFHDNTITVTGYAGISLSSSSSNVVEYNSISGPDRGVYLHDGGLGPATENTVSDNTITGADDGILLGSGSTRNLIDGNEITGSDFAGVHVQTTSDNTISSNTVIGGDYGLYSFKYSHGNTIEKNTFTNNGTGIYIAASWDETVAKNIIEEPDGDGITLFAASSGSSFEERIRVERNTITGAGATGIKLDSSNALIAKNLVTQSGEHGISVEGSDWPRVDQNEVTHSGGTGIWAYDSELVVMQNLTTHNAEHGIAVAGSYDWDYITWNTASRNGGTGIEVLPTDEGTLSRVGWNQADFNDAVGIRVNAYVTDLGGNTAKHNDTADCIGLTCDWTG